MAKAKKKADTINIMRTYGITMDGIYSAIRNGVADGIVRIMEAPGVFPAADFLQAVEEGAAKGIGAALTEMKGKREDGPGPVRTKRNQPPSS